MRRLAWVLLLIPVLGIIYLGVSTSFGAHGIDVHLKGRGPAQPGTGSDTPVSLAGTYGVREGAETEPMLKVEQAKTGGYLFTERITGEWLADPEQPHVATEAEVGQALGLSGPPGFRVYGLTTSRATLLHVPPGWSGQGAQTTTGFVLVSNGRLLPASKVELGGR